MSHQSKGFSLVELALSLTIIGVLVATIVKGNEFITNSRISATMSQVTQYQQALESFRSLYFGLPGDLPDAPNELPGCADIPSCVGGDGNGVIVEDGGDGSDWTAWSRTNIANLSTESVQFWKHLAVVNLIDGVDPTYAAPPFEWGLSHPKSPLGGGYEFFHDTSNTMGHSSHFMRLSADGIHSGGSVDIVSPQVAETLDRRFDDGYSFTGNVVVDYGTASNDCHSNGVYKTKTTAKVCTLFFVFKD